MTGKLECLERQHQSERLVHPNTLKSRKYQQTSSADMEHVMELQCSRSYRRRSRHGWATRYEHRNNTQAQRDDVKEAKDQLEFRAAGSTKGNIKNFYHYCNSKRLDKEKTWIDGQMR